WLWPGKLPKLLRRDLISMAIGEVLHLLTCYYARYIMIIGIIHVASVSWDYRQNEEKGIWRTI
ncbi:MAG TPA: hypothetical protein PL076_08560, partial [Bacillota bacterium]|nr:hypothetical protein [Bacillota bacterium]